MGRPRSVRSALEVGVLHALGLGFLTGKTKAGGGHNPLEALTLAGLSDSLAPQQVYLVSRPLPHGFLLLPRTSVTWVAVRPSPGGPGGFTAEKTAMPQDQGSPAGKTEPVISSCSPIRGGRERRDLRPRPRRLGRLRAGSTTSAVRAHESYWG